MNEHHHAAHEEQLFGLCAGVSQARDLRAAFEGSALASCASCRELVDDLAVVETTLARAAADERALERSARGARPAPGEERAWREISAGRVSSDPVGYEGELGGVRRRAQGTTPDAALEGENGGVRAGAHEAVHTAAPRAEHRPEPRSEPRRARRPVTPARLAAAAAVLIGACVLSWRIARPSEPQVVLGPGRVAVEALHPVGSVPGFAPFTWRAELPPRGWFVVRVEGRRDDGTPFRSESAHLVEDRWDPGEADLSRWPRELRWEVLVFDASGQGRGSTSASASRGGP